MSQTSGVGDGWRRPAPTARQRRIDELVAVALAAGAVSSVCLFLALFTAGAWTADRTMARAVRLVVVVVMFAWLAYVLSATAWAEGSQGKGGDELLPPATATMIWVAAVNVLYFGAAW